MILTATMAREITKQSINCHTLDEIRAMIRDKAANKKYNLPLEYHLHPEFVKTLEGDGFKVEQFNLEVGYKTNIIW